MARGRHPTRLHIARPDEQVLSKYLRSWYGGDIIREPDRFPGISSIELFGNNNPLELDLGCGMGVLTCSRAQNAPHINIIGIDISQKPIFCAITEAYKLGLDNVKFIRSNFNALLPLIKPETVSTAYYLFPNPPGDYFYSRANSGRKKFIQTIYNALVPSGKFIFATDSIEFFTCIENIIKNELLYHAQQLDIKTAGISTWYQGIWESRGMDVRGMVVEKSWNAQNVS